jgi:hypothetical protein
MNPTDLLTYRWHKTTQAGGFELAQGAKIFWI